VHEKLAGVFEHKQSADRTLPILPEKREGRTNVVVKQGKMDDLDQRRMQRRGGPAQRPEWAAGPTPAAQ
jgi:hypothetical protein